VVHDTNSTNPNQNARNLRSITFCVNFRIANVGGAWLFKEYLEMKKYLLGDELIQQSRNF
jgi:hypothetical protein